MSHAGSLPWLARHEFRLAWRDWIAMMTAGKRGRAVLVAAAAAVLAIAMHLLAWRLVGSSVPDGVDPDQAVLILVTGCALLSWSLTISQAMELVTRAFYARADLDLILSSPVSAPKVFAVRIAAIAFSTTMLTMLLAAPFINALAFAGGARWLGAYGVVVAMGLTATALSVGVTIALFRTLGPKRTRLVAQIVAAVVGAAFVIGVQALAILSTNTLSRFAALHSGTLRTYAPSPDNAFWWAARAIMGDRQALLGCLMVSLILLGLAVGAFANRFALHATAAAGVGKGVVRQRNRRLVWPQATPGQTLRRKEFLLLRRDPWLISQTLMQVLYLLPPALLLWRNFGAERGAIVVLVPVFVMAAGQLAGGLAWLAVSGEDAPDLVATAPLPPRQIMRAKIEAVVGAIAVVLSPFVAALAIVSPRDAVVAAAGILVAAGSATLIQLWFRTQAKRSHFRRRQTSSRAATFAEAFSSIAWAAAAGMAANGDRLAAVPATIALLILLGARLIRPR